MYVDVEWSRDVIRSLIAAHREHKALRNVRATSYTDRNAKSKNKKIEEARQENRINHEGH